MATADQTFRIRRNDTRPTLVAEIKEDGTLKSWAAGSAVSFAMFSIDDGATIPTVGTASFGATGYLNYAWAAADTATSGRFIGQFRVDYTPSGQQTFPPTGTRMIIEIADDLDAS